MLKFYEAFIECFFVIIYNLIRKEIRFMDNAKIGRLISKLRKENNLTQLQLADMMNISDKTVSKYERIRLPRMRKYYYCND